MATRNSFKDGLVTGVGIGNLWRPAVGGSVLRLRLKTQFHQRTPPSSYVNRAQKHRDEKDFQLCVSIHILLPVLNIYYLV